MRRWRFLNSLSFHARMLNGAGSAALGTKVSAFMQLFEKSLAMQSARGCQEARDEQAAARIPIYRSSQSGGGSPLARPQIPEIRNIGKTMTDAHRLRPEDRPAKGETKVKMVLGAILICATLLGVNELASTVYRADHGAPAGAVVMEQ
jgi:hypothetical protein